MEGATDIFLLPVFEKWAIFSGFSAIMHRIVTALGGDTVYIGRFFGSQSLRILRNRVRVRVS